MSVKTLPKELRPTDEDYVYYLTNYDLSLSDTDYYYKQTWKDYIDLSVKDDFKDYIREMRDDRNDEIENEGRDMVPPFNEWHESNYDFKPTLEEYIKKNKDEIYNQFKEYVREISSPQDYFELDEEQDD